MFEVGELKKMNKKVMKKKKKSKKEKQQNAYIYNIRLIFMHVCNAKKHAVKKITSTPPPPRPCLTTTFKKNRTYNI